MTYAELDEARAKEAERVWHEQGCVNPRTAIIAARLAREGWKPPEPVDPDVLAWREWFKGQNGPQRHASIDAGEWDYAGLPPASHFFAGVRYARGEKV